MTTPVQPLAPFNAPTPRLHTDMQQLNDFLGWLNVKSMEEVDKIIRIGRRLPDRQSQRYILDALRALAQRQELIAGQYTAQWWQLYDPDTNYIATPGDALPLEQINSELGWAIYAPKHQANEEVLRMAVANVIKKHVWGGQRETVRANALRRGTLFRRIARENACAFCRVLATRGGVYYYHDSKHYDPNFFDPKKPHKKKWIKKVTGFEVTHARGKGPKARKLGDPDYHDHCKCTLVPDFSPTYKNPPDYLATFDKQYTDARNAAEKKGLALNMSNITKIMREAGQGA